MWGSRRANDTTPTNSSTVASRVLNPIVTPTAASRVATHRPMTTGALVETLSSVQEPAPRTGTVGTTPAGP